MTDKPDLPWSDHPAWRSVDCGPGWWPIVARLDQDLREVYPDYRVTQVKEKFGTLRYYTEGYTDAMGVRIREAEEESARTCEECGQPGTLRTDRWYRTLCDADEAKRQEWRAKMLAGESLDEED